MSKLYRFFVDFQARQDGPTTVEYAVLLGLIVVACISAITSVGNQVDGTTKVVASAIGSSPQEENHDGGASHDNGHDRD